MWTKSHSNELIWFFGEITRICFGAVPAHFCLFGLLKKADGCCFWKHLLTPRRLMCLNMIINSSIVPVLHLWQEANKPEKLPIQDGSAGGTMVIFCAHNTCVNAMYLFTHTHKKMSKVQLKWFTAEERTLYPSFQRNTITIWTLLMS